MPRHPQDEKCKSRFSGSRQQKAPAGTDTRKELEKLVNTRYKSTVHIDRNAVIHTFAGSGSFDELPLSGDAAAWPREVSDIFEKMKQE